jgi:hypothetical protein
MTKQELFQDFLTSDDTLRIYQDNKLVFSSQKERLLPLMDFIKERGATNKPVTIFDKVSGNAAALLSVKAGCSEVFSPLGSELGVETLKQHKIAYHLDKVVPYIMRDDGKDMCPMERLSIDKTPDEFHAEMKKRIEGKKG